MIKKYIKTNENWYPNINNVLVRVSIVKLRDQQTPWRICLWGGDDFGMEYDSSSFDKVNELFQLFQDYTSQKELFDLGFVRA